MSARAAEVPPRLAAALAERYRVERELGQGGMATVYLAEDLKHHRKVALKVLRPELAATLGPERFSREIEVAARLQHPHILPLHDSGEAQGFLYYVMPFVDGESLRGRLARQGELPVQEAVRLLAQVADALAYAHAQGVVHRDIKPDNVLLSGRHALVTDFGVAKAVTEAGAREAGGGREQLTTAGIALGTPAYMAPEQAAADPNLDHRVDIYALGAMGFELLAGRPPFVGRSSQEVLAAHLTTEPEPLSSIRPSIPAGLAAVVMRCLAKRPADRWSSADELLAQLEAHLTPGAGTTPAQTVPIARGRADARLRRLVLIGAAVLALVAVGLVLARRPAPAPPGLGRRAAVTLDPGLELNPAVSPDGKFVAYSRMTPAESRLVVQQLAGGEPVTVARWPGLVASMPAWSPDGSRLLYRSPRGLEVVPAFGGGTRLVTAAPDGLGTAYGKLTWGSWAPDGRRVVYASADTLYVRDLEGGEPRALLNLPELHSPTWSPDGRWIALVSGNVQYEWTANLAPSSIWVAPASGGPPIRITDDRPLHTSPIWMPDSRGLLYVSDADGGRDVYFVRVGRHGAPDGPAVRLTTGLHPHTISLSSDGRTLLYSLHTESSNIVAVGLQSRGSVSLHDARAVTSGSQVVEGVAVSPDGKWLAFDSNRNGKQDIWRMSADGSAPAEPISAGPEDEFQPAWTADGRAVGFHAVVSGSRRDLYVVPAAGGPRTRIRVPTPNNLAPKFSPDGRRLLYTEWAPDGGVWMHEVKRAVGDTGWSALTPVLKERAIVNGGADWSPDGKWISRFSGRELVRQPPDGSAPQVLARLPEGFDPFYSRWASDSRTVYCSGIRGDGVYVVYGVPVGGGEPREVTHSDGPTFQNFRFPFAVHDSTIYLTLADRQSDIWKAEVLRP